MKRPRQHVMEDISEQLMKRLLPPNWITRKLDKDYGVDYEIEIVEDDVVTGTRVWVQLKSQESCDIKVAKNVYGSDGKFICYSISTYFVKYVLLCPFPVLLFLADLNAEKIYFINIKDEIIYNTSNHNMGWHDQKTITLKLPKFNELSKDKNNGYLSIKWFADQPNLESKINMLTHICNQFNYINKFEFAEFCDNDIDDASYDYLYSSFEAIINTINIVSDLERRFVFLSIKNNPFRIVAYNSRRSYKYAKLGLAILKSGVFSFAQLATAILRSQDAINSYIHVYGLYDLYKRKFLLNIKPNL